MAGIITILAALVPFGIWLWKNHAAKAADPKTQNEKRYEQADKDIAGGNATDASIHGVADLDALDRLSSGQGH